jgi:hypothetical protein
MARRGKPPGLLDAGNVYQQLARPRSYSLYDDDKPKFSQPPKKDDDDEIRALIRHVHVTEISRRRGVGSSRTYIPEVVDPFTLKAGTGYFSVTGEDMTVQAGYSMTAQGAVGSDAFTLSGQNATLTPPAASLIFLAGGSAPSTTTGSTSINYGTLNYSPGNSRVIVAIQWTYNGGGQAITGVTVGGVALVQVAGAANYGDGGSGSSAIDVWISSAPLSGSSGAVVVTANQAFPWYSSAAVYSLKTSSSVRADVSVKSNAGSTIIATNINVPAGGVALALSSGSNGATFSNFTPGTVDATETPPGRVYAYGHVTTTGSVNVIATFGTPDSLVLTAVSWGP